MLILLTTWMWGAVALADLAKPVSILVEETHCEPWVNECRLAVENVCDQAAKDARARAVIHAYQDRQFSNEYIEFKPEVSFRTKRIRRQDSFGGPEIVYFQEYTQTCRLVAQSLNANFLLKVSKWKRKGREEVCDPAFYEHDADSSILYQRMHKHLARHRWDAPSECSGEQIQVLGTQ